MKTSAVLFLTEIMPEKRKLYGRIIKNKIFNGYTPTEVFRTMKEAGVDGVEILLPSFSQISETDIKRLKHVLDSHEMPIFSLHQKLRFLTKTKMKEITELFHFADLLGAKVIVLHMNTLGKSLFDEKYITKIHELQKQYGIKVGFENQEKQPWALRRPYGWDQEAYPAVVRNADFHLTLDTTHLAQAGGDIITFFKKHKDRIVNIHISDYKEHMLNNSLRPFRYKHLPLGKGTLPMKEFIALLHKEKYRGLVTMEIHTDLQGVCDGAKLIKHIN